jgi:hypothetical protein
MYTSEGWLSKLSSFFVWGSFRSISVPLRGEVLPFCHLLRMATADMLKRKRWRKGCTIGQAVILRAYIAEARV